MDYDTWLQSAPGGPLDDSHWDREEWESDQEESRRLAREEDLDLWG